MEFIRTKLLAMSIILLTSQPTLSNPEHLLHIEAAPRIEVEEEPLSTPRFTRENDIRLLAMTCTAEAETESRQGRILVMATLINRAEQNNTTLLHEVSRPHQFPWWARGVRRVNPECVELAREYVLNHRHTTVTHFHHRRVRPHWARRSAIQYVEGVHIFYNLQ